MAPVVPFGHYVPGTSIVHRLDARVKLLLVVAYVFALFMVDGWFGLLVCLLLFVGVYLLSGIPARLMFRGLKPILILLVFTFFANAFTFSADAAALAEAAQAAGATGATGAAGITGTGAEPSAPESIALIGSFGIKPLGVLRGLYFIVRIVLLISLTSLLTYTTSIVSLTDSFVSLMRPLARLKVPTEDIATMFSIALRFIPVTAEEAERIMVAQSARGAVFNKGGPIKRARAWIPVMVPLFVSLFRRADELACAMETRCYVGEGRTHIRVVELSEIDLAIGVIGILALAFLGIIL
ncbi:MAG: energy-coupling factor transporter transmembrane protein EcfT [Coriobacteriales bacterium]|jgi:energy-coupling factor transport system permease protein|nr:energy-coupling factor transporter transmembrane protein EcfT [Coriobacteriales bacterium]